MGEFYPFVWKYTWRLMWILWVCSSASIGIDLNLIHILHLRYWIFCPISHNLISKILKLIMLFYLFVFDFFLFFSKICSCLNNSFYYWPLIIFNANTEELNGRLGQMKTIRNDWHPKLVFNIFATVRALSNFFCKSRFWKGAYISYEFVWSYPTSRNKSNNWVWSETWILTDFTMCYSSNP